MKVRFGEKPETEWYTSGRNLRLAMMDYPRGDFRSRCVEMMKATWSDEPFDKATMYVDKDINIGKEFLNILKMKVLPNSLESLNFTFRMEGLTLIEVTHLLRHRMLKSIHAQCSADRFLQKDSCFIPSSIVGTEFEKSYKSLTYQCKELYANMIDSGDVSILDARYILTRNHRYFYYFTIDLKTAIQFIHQRKCTQIQPEMDNYMAHYMHDAISSIIPEFKDVVSLECNERCVYIQSSPEHSSRVYMPDDVHSKVLHRMEDKMMISSDEANSRREKNYYLHQKTRKQMGVKFCPQDLP